ncbi:C40 family peptidase [Dokdonella sp.]|jgi:hypothetical protein|uniref:C40 family peptidase n=1 Tax=Dokdonella sp. TaxID=2291710 RepID=UPI002C9B02ED|nr:C40 family peptidase [Dokdonella sp.]
MQARRAALRLSLLCLSGLLMSSHAMAQSGLPWLEATGLAALNDSAIELSVPLMPHALRQQEAQPQPAMPLAKRLLDLANTLRDIRYRRGGRSPASGFDCSGFVSYVFRNGIGVDLPNTSAAQYRDGREVERDQLQRGDLVFFRTRGKQISHVGMYIGDGEFIHAPSRGKRVSVSRLSTPYWAHRFVGAKRTEALAFAQDREALKPVDLGQRLAISASISSASLGTPAEITSGSPEVTITSSSMRMPMPR